MENLDDFRSSILELKQINLPPKKQLPVDCIKQVSQEEEVFFWWDSPESYIQLNNHLVSCMSLLKTLCKNHLCCIFPDS